MPAMSKPEPSLFASQQKVTVSETVNEQPQAAQGKSSDTAGRDFDLNHVEMIWPRVIEYVKSKRMSNGIFLSEAEPVEVNDSVITLGFPQEFQFHKEMLEKDNSKKLVEEAFEVCLNTSVRVQMVTTQPESEDVEQQVSQEDAQNLQTEEDERLKNVLTETMNIFEGARIVRKDP